MSILINFHFTSSHNQTVNIFTIFNNRCIYKYTHIYIYIYSDSIFAKKFTQYLSFIIFRKSLQIFRPIKLFQIVRPLSSKNIWIQIFFVIHIKKIHLTQVSTFI